MGINPSSRTVIGSKQMNYIFREREKDREKFTGESRESFLTDGIHFFTSFLFKIDPIKTKTQFF